MEHDVTPHWTEIKKYEEALANDPASYCFVPLAELYRKMGLLDDAIFVAQKGCTMHPDYVGGFMALGRAYFDKGMRLESEAALKKVIVATPDNLLARRILSQIYAENGETAAAAEHLQFILSHNPADQESQVLLNSLENSSNVGFYEPSTATFSSESEAYSITDSRSFDFFAEEDEIIEDAELLEELGDDESPVTEEFIFAPADESQPATGNDVFIEESDPLRTVTMAELYVSQGFLKRALTIYRELLETDPDNDEWKSRLYELKMAIDEDGVMARKNVADGSAADADTYPVSGQGEPVDGSLPAAGSDRVLATLENWLDTIRRRG